jgi:catechol 2,3-dioxygenase-like lactoylglutathione lyase family enzyme
MSVNLTKDSIDLGIVTNDAAASIAFYRDVLGFEDLGEFPMPGGVMRRLQCGTSTIKIVALKRAPEASAPPGGIGGGTGYRYWTISVSNLAEIVATCEAAGAKIAIPITELRPGVTIAMVEDPDGNWVEFLGAQSD